MVFVACHVHCPSFAWWRYPTLYPIHPKDRIPHQQQENLRDLLETRMNAPFSLGTYYAAMGKVLSHQKRPLLAHWCKISIFVQKFNLDEIYSNIEFEYFRKKKRILFLNKKWDFATVCLAISFCKVHKGNFGGIIKVSLEKLLFSGRILAIFTPFQPCD